jgi:hypothetical protein
MTSPIVPTRRTLLASAPAIALGLGAPAPARAAQHRLTVLELFTSQGCSSCPPADAVLARLAAEEGVLALSRPVTYWDRLGWTDTLARESHDSLQRAYAKRGVGAHENRVYTPQLIIDGRLEAIGSREADVRAKIAQARQATPDTEIDLGQDAAGRATASICTKARDFLVRHVRFAPRAVIAIGRGENAGATVTYTNVVRSEATLGTSLGPFVLARPPSASFAEAILVQAGEAGTILAAARL